MCSFRIPLQTFVWLTLLGQSHQPNPAVFKAVTMALFFLVEDDGKLDIRTLANIYLQKCRTTVATVQKLIILNSSLFKFSKQNSPIPQILLPQST